MSFVFLREYSLGKKLIESYLKQPYMWILNKNSSDLSKNILSKVSSVTQGPLQQIINLLSQIIVTFFLISLLLYVDYKLAISVGSILIFCYVLIFFSLKKFLKKIGRETLIADQERYKAVSEAFGSFKLIKNIQLENFYINKFSKPAKIYAKNSGLSFIIAILPRYLLEGIAFGGMILLVLILMNYYRSFENIIPIIALYAIVGYRLLPSLQVIYNSTSQLRYSYPALDSLHKDFMSLEKFDKKNTLIEHIKFENLILLKDISFRYPNSEFFELKKINLKIPYKSKVAFIGPTGSGKTTLVDIILGLIRPDTGQLIIDNNLLVFDDKKNRSWIKNIGYVPQDIFLIDDTIASNIAIGVDKNHINKKNLEKVCKIANIHNFINQETAQGYDTVIGDRGIRLSGGQKQRIGIARALYHNPRILVLDEATSALDNLTEQAVIDAINNLDQKITMIFIAHRLSTIKRCDYIYFMEEGEIKAQGSYKDLIKKSEKFKQMILTEK